MKKPSKAKKASAKKASAKKVSKKKSKVTAKAKAKKTPKKKAAKKVAVGCCTLTGSGPDQQFEGITKAECRQRAIAAGKNDHWVAGLCAQPD
jgi:hypothetical protein